MNAVSRRVGEGTSSVQRQQDLVHDLNIAAANDEHIHYAGANQADVCVEAHNAAGIQFDGDNHGLIAVGAHNRYFLRNNYHIP